MLEKTKFITKLFKNSNLKISSSDTFIYGFKNTFMVINTEI